MKVRRYVYTARRKAALRKAQLVSAARRKRRNMSPATKKKIQNAALIGGVGALTGAAVYGGARKGYTTKTRKAQRIDQIVADEWGPGGAKRRAADAAFGKEVATLNRDPAVRGRGTPDRRRGPLRPYVPSAAYPQDLDRQVFIRSMWKLRQNKKGQWYKRPHSDDEMRRRRRNSVKNSPINDLHKRNISPWEALQRTNAYTRRMAAKGIIVNLSHKDLVYKLYREQRGDEF